MLRVHSGGLHPPLFSFASLLLPLLVLVSLPSRVSAATTIATFYDDACKDSYNGFSGPDGFPNGTCTSLNQMNGGSFKSFQVVELDPGCAVTIYDNNTSEGICSPVVLQVANIASCYNTTWTYYSIDGCTVPSSSSAPKTSSSSSTRKGSKKKHRKHTAAIAGGVVGGIAGGAAIAALSYFLLRRRLRARRAAHMGSAPQGPPAELPHDGHVSEMGSGPATGVGAVAGRQGIAGGNNRHEMHSPALPQQQEKNAEMEAVVPSELGGGIEGRTRDEVEQEKTQPVEMEGDVRWMWEGRGGAGDGSVGTQETKDEKEDRKRWSWER
ncbi:hypothetical protein IWZ01DRAFT_134993 [Phyllosticta capitalensis]